MNAVIIEDEYPAQKELERLCEESDMVNLKGIFNDVSEAADSLINANIDLIFLDVIANDTDNNIETLIDLCDEKLVIITTAYKEHAYKSFKINTVDLLEKPINKKTFQAAVYKAYRKYQQDIENYFVIKNYRIPFDNIAYVISGFLWNNLNENEKNKKDSNSKPDSEKKPNYSREKYIVLKNKIIKDIRVHDNELSFNKFEDCLPKDRFLRINKNVIIAIDMIIERIEKDLIILKDGNEFSVGTAYIKNVNSIFNKSV